MTDGTRSRQPTTATTDANVRIVSRGLVADSTGDQFGGWDIGSKCLGHPPQQTPQAEEVHTLGPSSPHRRAEGLPHFNGSCPSSTVQEGRRCLLGQNSNWGGDLNEVLQAAAQEAECRVAISRVAKTTEGCAGYGQVEDAHCLLQLEEDFGGLPNTSENHREL